MKARNQVVHFSSTLDQFLHAIHQNMIREHAGEVADGFRLVINLEDFVGFDGLAEVDLFEFALDVRPPGTFGEHTDEDRHGAGDIGPGDRSGGLREVDEPGGVPQIRHRVRAAAHAARIFVREEGAERAMVAAYAVQDRGSGTAGLQKGAILLRAVIAQDVGSVFAAEGKQISVLRVDEERDDAEIRRRTQQELYV
jgi:hypothetical protein